MFNINAVNNKDYQLEVSLDFEHEGIQYNLTREASSPTKPTLSNNDNIKESLNLVKKEIQTILTLTVRQPCTLKKVLWTQI